MLCVQVIVLCVQVFVLCAHAVCDATVVEISQPTSNGVFICCLWCGKCQNMSHIMLCVQVIMLCVQVIMLCVQVIMLCVQVIMMYVHAVCDTTGDHDVCTCCL